MAKNSLKHYWRVSCAGIFLIALLTGCTEQPGSPKALALHAALLYKKAVKGYEKIVMKNPRNEGARLALAKLYAEHGDYQNVVSMLNDAQEPTAKQLLAICLYKSGEYTRALSMFDRLGKIDDPEYLYYYGLTCQQHNLYEQALALFKQIKNTPYLALAKERLASIERQSTEYLSSLEPEFKNAIIEATKEKYPLAGAAVILADETLRLTLENTLISEARYIIKILNDRGKNDFSEIVIGYDSTYETVEVTDAKTIKPNGEAVSVGEKDIRDVSRYMNFPLYSNARARIISMPEITEGAIIEYKVRSTQSQLINKKDFTTAYTIQENEPIVFGRFTLRIPEERELKIKILNPRYNTLNFTLDPRRSNERGEKAYAWEFRDIPQIELEPNMPPVSEITPILLISTFTSWDEIYRWWWDLAKDRMSLDSAIIEKANELIKGKNTPEEKIRAIYNYCVQEIRYVGIEYGQAGYQPHQAQEIFKNKYGDCKDKAVLFVAMLEAAGIPGHLVLIGTYGTPVTSEDFPAVNFNHCIAAVELDKKLVFLDITAEVCSFGDLPADDQERKVVVFKKDGYTIVSTPVIPPEGNFINYVTRITLQDDETITASRQVRGLGEFDQMQRFWLRYTPANLIEQGLKEKVQSMVTSGNLLAYEYENADTLDKPIKLTYTFEGRNFLSRAGNARILPQFAQQDTSSVAKDSRLYPLELGSPSLMESVFEMVLPKTIKVKYLPKTFTIKNQWGEYVLMYSVKGKTLTVTQRQVSSVKQIPKEEYSQFKKFLEDLAIQADEHVILEKK